MASITLTDSQVALTGTARVSAAQWGHTVTNGSAVYLKSSDGKYWMADATTNIAEANVRGIVLDKGTGGAGNWGTVVTSGPIDLGAQCATNALMVADYSVLLAASAGAGEIMSETDANVNALAAGEFHCHIGVARTNRILEVAIKLHTTAVL